MTRYVSREEYEAAIASFPMCPEDERADQFAIIEAYEKGRAHPDSPGEERRERARRKRAVDKATKQRKDREARWRKRGDALFGKE